MGFLSNMMKAPVPGSRGAQFGSAMGEMAPLLFSMAQGLRSGQGAAAYAPQGLAAMMVKQERDRERADEMRRERDAQAAQAAAERMTAEVLGMYGGGTSQYDAMAATGGPTNAAAAMTNSDFIEQMWPHALRVSQATGLDPRLVVAQAAQETGWGKHAPNNNYFGIKSHGRPGGATLATKEVYGGRPVAENASFRTYGGMGQSADDYAAFLQQNPRYRELLSSPDLESQITALGRSGYATDPNYAASVGRIAAAIKPPNQGQQPRVSPQRAAAILINPNVPEAVKNKIAAQFMPQEQEKPQIVKGADGYNYWVAPGMEPQRVVPNAKAPDTGWRTLTPDQAAALGYDPAKGPYQIGLSGENRGKVTTGSGQTINVGGGPNMGTIPAGHVALEDPSAPGGYRVVPMEGTEAAAKLAAQAGKQGRIEERKNSELSIALDDVSRIKALVNKDTKIPVFGSTTTGIMGGLLSNIPSTDAGSISGMLKTLESFTAYEKLQAIRDASDTGGGVGQVSNYETRLMAAIYGELNQSRNKAQFLYNLDRFGSTLRRIADEGISDEEAKLLTDQILTGGDDPLGLFK